MKQKCCICKKSYANLRMHLQRSSKCAHWAQMKNAPTDSQNIVHAAAETNDSNNSVSVSNDNGELGDNLLISNAEHDQYVFDSHDFNGDVDFGFALPTNDSKRKSKTQKNVYNHQCRVEEYVMQGIEDLSIANENEDFAETENVSNKNIYDGGNDEFTIESEPPFFPLPAIALQTITDSEQPIVATTGNLGAPIPKLDQLGAIYAPISMFQFHRPFTNEEFFMIKLCSICDRANVPHHIVDDIVDLLRESKRKNIVLDPEQLRTRIHFLKHLENHFKSPIPQSIIVGLEGFSSNDIQYSRGLRDTVEIIWYDFKEQALDLIHDIEIWGNLDNFKGFN